MNDRCPRKKGFIHRTAAVFCASFLLLSLAACGSENPAETLASAGEGSSATEATTVEKNNTTAGTLPIGPAVTIPVDVTTAPETISEAPTTSEPYPTDTEYVGPAFDYTRMPAHYLMYGEDFGISRYTSPLDKDGDGVDDQTDIFLGAKAYLAQKPQYNASSYYAGGYPKVNEKGILEGVCTDVVAAGLLAAGYDLKAMVDQDIANHPEWFSKELADKGYGSEGSFVIGEKNIDFRRVRNLYVFMEHHAEKLTLDLTDLSAWQPGDIVVFFGSSGLWNGHIAVISDRRAEDGVPYVLHHANEGQTLYEEDYLVSTNKTIMGHYRWNGYNGE